MQIIDEGTHVRGGALDRPTRIQEWTRLTTVHWLMQTAGDVAPDDLWLAPAERDRLALLRSPKRRRDWRLGRWTVKQAIARLFVASGGAIESLAEIVIHTQANGAPYSSVDGWNVPFPISISHSHDRGLCAVAPPATIVGCDLERVEPRSDDFTREWFTRAEQDAIARVEPEERHHIVTLFWSAKESALKAIGTGLTVSTSHVTVTASRPAVDDLWSGFYVNRSGDPVPLRGWWRKDGGDLITIVTVPALGRPVALSDGRIEI